MFDKLRGDDPKRRVYHKLKIRGLAQHISAYIIPLEDEDTNDIDWYI